MRGYADDKDIVIFEIATTANIGQVVAVHFPNDGLVVKRFMGIQDRRIMLGNENKDYEFAFEAPEGATIRGVSLGVWKPEKR